MKEPEPKKSLGQHWLTDENTLEYIVSAANVSADDVVLEIGPGLGTLTEILMRQAREVIAVEFDRQLARELPKRVKADNLSVVEQDILSFDFTEVPPHYKVVANIPYYLTSNLIRVLSETSNPSQMAVLLIQKEVAERLAAQPGGMSLLSVTAQFYWEVSLGEVVKAELFMPPPKVDSQVVILQHRVKPLFPDIEPKDFFRLVKIGFAQRRKTILNSLSSGLHLDREEVTRRCEMAQIDPGRRPQTLSLEEWWGLYHAVQS